MLVRGFNPRGFRPRAWSRAHLCKQSPQNGPTRLLTWLAGSSGHQARTVLREPGCRRSAWERCCQRARLASLERDDRAAAFGGRSGSERNIKRGSSAKTVASRLGSAILPASGWPKRKSWMNVTKSLTLSNEIHRELSTKRGSVRRSQGKPETIRERQHECKKHQNWYL